MRVQQPNSLAKAHSVAEKDSDALTDYSEFTTSPVEAHELGVLRTRGETDSFFVLWGFVQCCRRGTLYPLHTVTGASVFFHENRVSMENTALTSKQVRNCSEPNMRDHDLGDRYMLTGVTWK